MDINLSYGVKQLAIDVEIAAVFKEIAAKAEFEVSDAVRDAWGASAHCVKCANAVFHSILYCAPVYCH